MERSHQVSASQRGRDGYDLTAAAGGRPLGHPAAAGRKDQRQQKAVDSGGIHQLFWPYCLFPVWEER